MTNKKEQIIKLVAEASTIKELVTLVEGLRYGLLCNDVFEGDGTIDAFAEQHLLLALAAAESAQRELALADLHQVKAVAAARRLG